MTVKQLAEAFSSHRFDEVYDHLADDARWVLPGQDPLVGKAAIVEACRGAAEEFARQREATFTRFVSVADAATAAVDVVARYVDADGEVSVVSSADIYETDAAGRIVTITSYAVELET